MITFKIKSTTFKVETPEKQQAIIDYCNKITKKTGRPSHKIDGFKRFSSNPKYLKFTEGMSTCHYVREYEALNAYRFYGNGVTNSLFDNLSTNPQYSQDDSHIEEVQA